jgi:L-fuconolactonase
MDTAATLRIDSHHHFWDTTSGRFDYYWMSDEFAAIKGVRGPDQLRPLIADRGIDRTVVVQTIPSVEETEVFLATAEVTDFVAGVVGWVDLTDAAVGDRIAALQARPDGRWLRSIRHQVHDEVDAGWLLRPDVQRGLKAVEDADLAYDVLVRARELPAAHETIKAFPDSRFVVDHIAKPNIKAGEVEPWASRMKPLADYPNVYVKVSGMVTEADWVAWTPDDLAPYVGRLLEWFGPERLMFGSDWPVCTVAASYADVYDAAVHALGDLSEVDREWVFGRTAATAYRLTA